MKSFTMDPNCKYKTKGMSVFLFFFCLFFFFCFVFGGGGGGEGVVGGSWSEFFTMNPNLR